MLRPILSFYTSLTFPQLVPSTSLNGGIYSLETVEEYVRQNWTELNYGIARANRDVCRSSGSRLATPSIIFSNRSLLDFQYNFRDVYMFVLHASTTWTHTPCLAQCFPTCPLFAPTPRTTMRSSKEIHLVGRPLLLPLKAALGSCKLHKSGVQLSNFPMLPPFARSQKQFTSGRFFHSH